MKGQVNVPREVIFLEKAASTVTHSPAKNTKVKAPKKAPPNVDRSSTNADKRKNLKKKKIQIRKRKQATSGRDVITSPRSRDSIPRGRQTRDDEDDALNLPKNNNNKKAVPSKNKPSRSVPPMVIANQNTEPCGLIPTTIAIVPSIQMDETHDEASGIKVKKVSMKETREKTREIVKRDGAPEKKSKNFFSKSTKVSVKKIPTKTPETVDRFEPIILEPILLEPDHDGSLADTYGGTTRSLTIGSNTYTFDQADFENFVRYERAKKRKASIPNPNTFDDLARGISLVQQVFSSPFEAFEFAFEDREPEGDKDKNDKRDEEDSVTLHDVDSMSRYSTPPDSPLPSRKASTQVTKEIRPKKPLKQVFGRRGGKKAEAQEKDHASQENIDEEGAKPVSKRNKSDRKSRLRVFAKLRKKPKDEAVDASEVKSYNNEDANIKEAILEMENLLRAVVSLKSSLERYDETVKSKNGRSIGDERNNAKKSAGEPNHEDNKGIINSSPSCASDEVMDRMQSSSISPLEQCLENFKSICI